MTNEKLLEELRKEIKELREEVQRSRQLMPQPYPVYVPQPYYPQPWPWNPQPYYPWGTYISGTMTWQNPATGNYGIQSNQSWPLVNNASSVMLKCFPNLPDTQGEDEIDIGSAL